MNRLTLSTFIVSSLIVCGTAAADQIQWDCDGIGRWDAKENWNPKKVPAPGDDVTIPANSGTIIIKQNLNSEPIKLKSLTMEASDPDDFSKLTSAERGCPVRIETTGDIKIGAENVVTVKGGQANPAAGTENEIKLTSTGGSITIDGDVLGGRGPNSSVYPLGGDVWIVANKTATVGEAAKITGGLGGSTPGTDFMKSGRGGEVIIKGDRIYNNGKLRGGVGGSAGLGGSGKRGGVVSFETSGKPTPNDLDAGRCKVGDSEGGAGGLGSYVNQFNQTVITQAARGDVKAKANNKGVIDVPNGKKLKGNIIAFNSVGGTIDLGGASSAAVEADATVCMNVGVTGTILLAGADSEAIVAGESITFIGDVDVSESSLPGLTEPTASFADVPCDNCLADLNGDGMVDLDDLAIVMANYGLCDGECPADLNGDDMVDAADVGLVLALYGVCDG